MAYNGTNPVSVGDKTLKSHYDRAFDNTVANNARLDAMDLTAQRLWTMANCARLAHAADLGVTSDATDIAIYNQYAAISATSGAGSRIWRSSNYGKSWTADTSLDATFSTVHGLAFNSDGSKLVATGVTAGTDGLAYSSDYGDTWTSISTSSVSMLAVCWSGAIFVAVGNTGAIYTSSNGTSWTSRTAAGTPANISFSGVCWSAANSLFIAVGSDTTAGTHIEIQTSPDGITWTAQTAATTSEVALYDVAEIDFGANTYVVAVGINGVIQYSSTGTSWSNHSQTETTSAELMTIQQVPTGAIVGTDLGTFCLITNLTQRSNLRYPEDQIAPSLTAGIMAMGYSTGYGVVMAGVNGNIWQSFLNEITGL